MNLNHATEERKLNFLIFIPDGPRKKINFPFKWTNWIMCVHNTKQQKQEEAFSLLSPIFSLASADKGEIPI